MKTMVACNHNRTIDDEPAIGRQRATFNQRIVNTQHIFSKRSVRDAILQLR